MANPTPAELAAKAAELKAQATAAQNEADAAAEAAKEPRTPQEVIVAAIHALADITGNHPKVQPLLAELDKATAPPPAPPPAEPQAQ